MTAGASMEWAVFVVNCNDTGSSALNNNTLRIQLESPHPQQTMIVDLAPGTEIQPQAQIRGHDSAITS